MTVLVEEVRCHNNIFFEDFRKDSDTMDNIEVEDNETAPQEEGTNSDEAPIEDVTTEVDTQELNKK
ncbi:hypothetical protein GCM10007111_26640 [Virgibacillus kapii]|uniref:Uncharacterized protein n=1 Tax=Virgibacillus kapii TaxID=1638645 RepID=A0ABQ2DPP5_9BACI|nr:hypothetical protein GCM10007111_26640 [Virgibacillus kapii]